jgi:peptide/nickel transport system substrate-binding protein
MLPDSVSRRQWLKGAMVAPFVPMLGCGRYYPDNDVNDIRIGAPDVAPKLDPRFATDAFSTRICRLLYPALVDFDRSSLPTPWLASHWQWRSPTILWVGVKPGILFHHGTVLSAKDVVATYQSVLNMDTASPLRGPLRLLTSVSVADDGVLFEFQRPDHLALFRLTVPIMPADLLAHQHDFQRQPIGTGACQFVSSNDQYLRLVRPDGVSLTFLGVKDASVRLLKLVRNELDLLQNDLSPELIQHARTRMQINVKTRLGSTFSYIGVNMNDPVLSNPLVRQAIAHAIDRPRLARTIMDNMATPSSGMFTSDHWCSFQPINEPVFNPVKSRQLLAEAGYSVDHPIRLTYKTSTDATRVRLATVYQTMLADVGIELSVLSQDFGSFYSDIKQGQFQLYGLAWVGVKSPEIFEYAFASYSTPPTGANRGHYHSVACDAFIRAALDEKTLPDMAVKYRALQQHLLADLPMIPLWHDHHVMVCRDNIKQYVLAEDGRYDGLLSVIKDA